jgi:hypothetical protein
LLKVVAASNVIQADLHITTINRYVGHGVLVVPFWQFVHDFSATKILRLKMDFMIDDIAIDDENDQQDDGSDNHEVSDIPGLSECSFNCLQSSLRRVSLQFWMEKQFNCFGVQLVKFFANNVVLLEEMQIDDGNHKLHEHMNSKARRWISGDEESMVVLATLLHGCPAVRDLRLKLSKDLVMQKFYSIDQEARADFGRT